MDENQGWLESTRELWDELIYGEGVFRVERGEGSRSRRPGGEGVPRRAASRCAASAGSG